MKYQKDDLNQIDRYVEAGNRLGYTYCSAAELVNDPISSEPITFVVKDIKKPKINNNYTVTYQNAGNGLIFYRFDKLPQKQPSITKNLSK